MSKWSSNNNDTMYITQAHITRICNQVFFISHLYSIKNWVNYWWFYWICCNYCILSSLSGLCYVSLKETIWGGLGSEFYFNVHIIERTVLGSFKISNGCARASLLSVEKTTDLRREAAGFSVSQETKERWSHHCAEQEGEREEQKGGKTQGQS